MDPVFAEGGAAEGNGNRTYRGGNVGDRTATVVVTFGLSSAGLEPELALRPLFGQAPSWGTGPTK